MRDVDPAILSALSARSIKARNLIWFSGKAYSDGSNFTIGICSDVGIHNWEVIDPSDGSTTTRTYYGAGKLLNISKVPLTSDLSIRTVTCKLSQLDESVLQTIQEYNLKQQPVEIHRMLYVAGTHEQVAPAIPRFVGFTDKIDILTPQAGQEGGVTVTMVSATRELTRTSSALRSEQNQTSERLSTDHFFKYADIAGDIQLYWGKDKVPIKHTGGSGGRVFTGGGLWGRIAAQIINL